MRYIVSLALLCLASVAVAFATEPVAPEVDISEVIRWGDRVVVSGEGPRAGEEILFSMAMGPPELDSDMWHIVAWGHSSDDSIVKEFEKDPHLAAFVAKPSDTKRAWAHFNFYRVDDPSQQVRMKEYGVKPTDTFPIIFIQAPNNGQFGNPKVLIDRIEHKTGEQTKIRIVSSVALWCKKLEESGFRPSAHLLEKHSSYEEGRSKGRGQSRVPPWGKDVEIPPVGDFNPTFPFATEPSKPTQLSVAELQALAPGAPASFILEQFQAKAADRDAVALAWLIAKEKVSPTPTPTTVPNAKPPQEESPVPVVVQDGGGFLDVLLGPKAMATFMFLLVALKIYQQYFAKDNLLLKAIIDKLDSLGGSQTPSSK